MLGIFCTLGNCTVIDCRLEYALEFGRLEGLAVALPALARRSCLRAVSMVALEWRGNVYSVVKENGAGSDYSRSQGLLSNEMEGVGRNHIVSNGMCVAVVCLVPLR
jgi:hypothetical protein